ncbi:MAG: hybrid sensor histidine kinase/response regulator [Chitinivibrionales bacterium]|nr:hybrid sensor histidine kinase/response regulator [Chitinivibrionales bacterium]
MSASVSKESQKQDIHNTEYIQPHILIIDDELSICIAVQELLKLYDYRVSYALSAEEGIDFLTHQHDIDIVLLDIDLGGGLTGIEALPLLKNKHKNIQVIMFTSMSSLETGIACMKNGAYDYVTKPFNETAFLKILPGAIEKKRLAQMNDLYLNILVHDLKNPLQNIMGTFEYIKLLLKGAISEKTELFLSTGEKGISQINMMIGNIINISKFEKGTIAVHHSACHLKTLINRALELFNYDIATTPDKLVLFYGLADEFTLTTDPELLSRVLINILSNAFRYTPEHGTITLRVEQHGDDAVRFSITNTGSYIDEFTQKLIFDKYSKIYNESKKSAIQNFGLGLTFSKMAVEALEGTIWVESNQEKPQTTFHFTLKKDKA